MINLDTIFWLLIAIVILILISLIAPKIYLWTKENFKKTKYNRLGESSKIRLIHQINEAVMVLSENKVGAIITIVNRDPIDHLRTDGVKIDASISSLLLISIFNKTSPLHDGAAIISGNKITYVSTFYKITNKSLKNKFGARHRAAMGISEITDSITIVVSEETGQITFVQYAEFTHVKNDDFQKTLADYLA